MSIKKVILIALAIATFTEAEQPRRCGFFSVGTICNENLDGYYMCNGKDIYLYSRNCRKSQIFICGKNRHCPKDIEDPCGPKPSFTNDEVPKDFIFATNGTIRTFTPVGDLVQKTKAVIVQDFERQMLYVNRSFYDSSKNKTLIKQTIEIRKKENGVHKKVS